MTADKQRSTYLLASAVSTNGMVPLEMEQSREEQLVEVIRMLKVGRCWCSASNRGADRNNHSGACQAAQRVLGEVIE